MCIRDRSEYLNDLYGGNYTFSTEANPPSVSFALDESLLGPHRFCSLGFEPVNFNTGNFLSLIHIFFYRAGAELGPKARAGSYCFRGYSA